MYVKTLSVFIYLFTFNELFKKTEKQKHTLVVLENDLNYESYQLFD